VGELIVHPGLGKAASTAIQQCVLTSPGAPHSISRFSQPRNGRDYMEWMWWRGLMAPPACKAADAARQRLLLEIAQQQGRVALSDEVFSSAPAPFNNVVDNLAKLGVTVHLLVIIRRQVDLLESLYRHGMRSRVSALGVPRNHTVLLDRLSYEGDVNLWIEDLLAAVRHGDENLLTVLQYDRSVALLHERFGRDNVTVLPFEQLHARPEVASARLAALFGMTQRAVASGLGQRTNVTGQRLGDYRLGGLLERVGTIRAVAVPLRKLGLNRRRASRTAVSILSRLNLQHRAVVSDASSAAVQGFFREGNVRVSRELGSGLEGLGYY
jgi:hypothetical protein